VPPTNVKEKCFGIAYFSYTERCTQAKQEMREMENKIINSFIDKLIDWKEFELFIAEVYKDSDKVIVEHDVTLIGKSNAKRQIDVRVTQITKLHTYITIIECKRWKEPVTRQVIDVLYASVEDLNANKGVIFTTKGYEKGAIEYAKSKNIDIFIVRDIRDDEYGSPGKAFSLYLQMFNAKLENFDVKNPRYFSPLGLQPKSPPPSFAIHFTKEQEYPEHLQLFSLNKEKGPNLVKLLIDIRADLLEKTSDSFNHLLQPENGTPEFVLKTRVKLNFTDYKFRYIKYDSGFIELETMYFDFYRCISQSKMNFDRTESVDFALIVENYISKQRNFISKSKEKSEINLSKPIIDDKDIDESEIVQDNSMIKITTEHYVNFEYKKETKIKDTKEITVNLINEK